MKKLLFLICFFIPQAWAAPFPGAPGSILASPNFGTAFFGKGFKISSQGTSWIARAGENLTGQEVDMEFALKNAPAGSSATLRLTTVALTKNTNLDDYGKQWISEYASLGFDLLGTQKFQQKGVPGLVIDLNHPRHKKKVRQIFLLKEKTVVQVTCQDGLASFSTMLPDCNRWVKNFTWVEKIPTKSF